MISESNSGLIYANGQKRYIPLKFALPIAFLVSLLTLIIFSVIGAGSNAILAQIEVVLLAIFFCLPGILTRSKLRGVLFSVPMIWVVIIVYEFIIGGLLGSSSYNPYSVFGVLREPILGIIETNAGTLGFDANTIVFGSTTVNDLLSMLIILDLVIIAVVFFLGSFFASSVATLFWDTEGNIKIFAVILKPFAILFAIVFLLIMPITIHAVSSTTGAAGFIVGGLGELYAGFAPSNGAVVVAGQDTGIDFTNIDVENLREHTAKAKINFLKADERFNQLRGNLFFSFAINQLPEDLQNIDAVLDLVATMAEISGVMPEIYFILFNAQEGMSRTTQAISSTSSSNYDPNFKIGLDFIDLGFSNFTKAWNCKDVDHPEGIENCGLVYGIERASSITDVGELNNVINIEQFISALDSGLSALDKSWGAINPFLNGTYKTILATTALGENDLSKASSLIIDATGDFIQSDSILSTVTDVAPINITSGEQVIPIPIDGIINLAKDLNSLLIPFSYSAANGIDFFLSMQNLMTGMSAIDMSDNSTSGLDGTWDGISGNLAMASSQLSLASSNISIANNLLDMAIANPRYGSLNPVFVGEEGSVTVFRTVKQMVDEFDSNLELLSEMFTALTYSFEAYKAFGKASAKVHLALTDNATKAEVLGFYQDTKDNSALAWEILNNMNTTSGSLLDNGARISWMESFIWPSSPSNNPTNLNSTNIGFGAIPATYNGLWVVSKVMIELLNSTLLTNQIDAILDIVNNLGIGDLFGSG
ncbi:MAG: hypothetical protein HeimC3_48590 [Candidatus Heimdallarchaeota archaeon LC_3]|nr:MAG: hypothetical protein HeimC3_48590 [Candidatus Heimdallarchaeota archaeon LC_3]